MGDAGFTSSTVGLRIQVLGFGVLGFNVRDGGREHFFRPRVGAQRFRVLGVWGFGFI